MNATLSAGLLVLQASLLFCCAGYLLVAACSKFVTPSNAVAAITAISGLSKPRYTRALLACLVLSEITVATADLVALGVTQPRWVHVGALAATAALYSALGSASVVLKRTGVRHCGCIGGRQSRTADRYWLRGSALVLLSWLLVATATINGLMTTGWSSSLPGVPLGLALAAAIEVAVRNRRRGTPTSTSQAPEHSFVRRAVPNGVTRRSFLWMSSAATGIAIASALIPRRLVAAGQCEDDCESAFNADYNNCEEAYLDCVANCPGAAQCNADYDECVNVCELQFQDCERSTPPQQMAACYDDYDACTGECQAAWQDCAGECGYQCNSFRAECQQAADQSYGQCLAGCMEQEYSWGWGVEVLHNHGVPFTINDPLD